MSAFDGLAPGLIAVACVILAAIVWDAFRPTTVQAEALVTRSQSTVVAEGPRISRVGDVPAGSPATSDPFAGPQRGTVAYCKARAEGIAERACIVRVVFAPEGRRTVRRAVAVFVCESGLDPRAVNGEYRGIAQVSAAWRRDVRGFGPTTEQQARHALRVFRAVGNRWSPTWSCA